MIKKKTQILTKKEFEAAVLPPLSFEDSGYAADNDRWSAKLLYECATKQGCRPFRFDLVNFDYTNCPYQKTHRVTDMAYHMKRAMNSDLAIPIIIGPLGNVMDGFHRILKATISGKTFVMAYRLKELPDPDGKA